MYWFTSSSVYPNVFFAAQGIQRSLSYYEIDVFCQFIRYAIKEGNDKIYHVPESIEISFEFDDEEFLEKNSDYIRVQNYISYIGNGITENDIDDINLCLGFGLPFFAFGVARRWFRNWLTTVTSNKNFFLIQNKVSL